MIDCNRKIEHYRETPHPRELWSGRGGIILWSKWEKNNNNNSKGSEAH